MNLDQIRQGLLEKQKTYSDRLKERRASFEQANQVAGERFSGALSNDVPLDPGSVFGAFNSFQRAGAEFVQPVAQDLQHVEDQLLDIDMKTASQGAGAGADAKGYEALAKILGVGGSGAAPTVAAQPKPAAPGKQQSKPGIPPRKPQQASLLGEIVGGLTKPFVNTAKTIGGAAFEAGRAGLAAAGNKDVYAVDPVTGKAKVTNPFLSEEELATYSDPKKAAVKTAKDTAGVGSFAVPFGKGAGIARKVLIPGAAAGGLQAASEDDANATTIAQGIGAGALGAGVLHGAGTVAGKVLTKGKGAISKAGGLLTRTGDERAVQEFTRATPTMAAKASEQGRDLQKIAKKYFPEPVAYDEALGKIEERGNGGLIGTKLKEAEKTIQREIKAAGATIKFSPDELTKALEKEKRVLNKTVGNEENVKQVTQLVKDIQKKYQGGVTPKQLLDLKRAADSKFGRAVIDEQTGSVVAQVQKILGNTSRTLLKSRFKNIEEALDTESELLTIKPLLNRARGFSQTTEAGKKAFTWADMMTLLGGTAAGGGPNPLGIAMGGAALAGKKLAENPAAEQRIGQLLQKTGGLPGLAMPGQKAGQIGARAGSAAFGVEQEIDKNNDNEQDSTQHNISDDTVVNGSSQQPGRKITLDQLYQVLLDPSISSGMKTQVKDLYDLQEKAIKDAKGEDKPDAAAKKQLLGKAQAGISALDYIEEAAQSPLTLLAGSLPGAPGARQYEAAVSSLTDALGGLRTGASVSKEQQAFYRNLLPKLGDSPETIQYKIKALRDEFAGYLE